MPAQTYTAWQIRRYGGPEQLTPVTLPLPSPGPTEVLIRIHASAVSRADGMMRAGLPRFSRLFLGLRAPRNNLSGTCLSGEVIATGTDVTRFTPGDMVFGEAGLSFGANASHICLDQSETLVHKPDSLPHQDAAVLCDGPLTSLHFLRTVGALQHGQRLLVLGGSGSLGSAAVQIAKAMGAHVTATCSARNLSMVAALGADRVIDYNETSPFDGQTPFDVIFDTLGVTTFAQAKPALTPNGRYLCPVLTLPLLGAVLWRKLIGGKQALFSAAGLQKPAVLRALLEELTQMIAAQQVMPVMDRIYPLSDLPEAQRHMETGHKRGNIVVVPD